jgi:hypothetical protein
VPTVIRYVALLFVIYVIIRFIYRKSPQETYIGQYRLRVKLFFWRDEGIQLAYKMLVVLLRCMFEPEIMHRGVFQHQKSWKVAT